ncbi:MAG: S-adenosylmethionine-diacylglycerol 3-amino-3-carboxypropyl transferase [Bradyrhizobium sp.]|jgi:S-adenosylmethionine-diacylglycerol 3-amino-3-carboxypropyl transferase|nr:S-adenosylmethionine-diacylglycerol 3-amino-3-carboxypropyl transferase [Bradyrhizobium sp.]
MNTQLIADAVRNSRGEGEATVWDRLFAFWFRRLVYTQIWEDPEADLAALELPMGSTIVTISSGGCNALSYLTARPAQVYAVDLNEAHLSLLKLKLAGLRAFSSYAEFWQFFGEACSPANSELYRQRLWLMLDAEARAYWDKRNILGRPRHAYFTDGFYRHGMLGRFIGIAHVLAKFARIDLEALLKGRIDDPERIQALDRLHRLFHSPWARLITATPALLFSLGIPPQQRVLLGAGAPLNEVLLERLLRLINGHPNENNYFAWQALHRSYPGPGDRCLPPYLQASQFERMRNGAGLIIPVHANLRAFLESLPAREVDAVVLLDSQDWMAVEEIRALWNAIDRTGSDNVRVIFRTAGTESPLDSAELAPLRQIWRRDEERSDIGFERDRSGIYGGFHCYERR